jgi:hypothetical protein
MTKDGGQSPVIASLSWRPPHIALVLRDSLGRYPWRDRSASKSKEFSCVPWSAEAALRDDA